jgi:hypothetical protein
MPGDVHRLRLLGEPHTAAPSLAGRIEFLDLQNADKAQASFVLAFSGDTKRADEARDKIRASRAFARRAPASPDMLAWLDAVESEIETRFGEHPQGPPAHNHAEDIFATGEQRPSPVWLDWFSSVRLAGRDGPDRGRPRIAGAVGITALRTPAR